MTLVTLFSLLNVTHILHPYKSWAVCRCTHLYAADIAVAIAAAAAAAAVVVYTYMFLYSTDPSLQYAAKYSVKHAVKD